MQPCEQGCNSYRVDGGLIFTGLSPGHLVFLSTHSRIHALCLTNCRCTRMLSSSGYPLIGRFVPQYSILENIPSFILTMTLQFAGKKLRWFENPDGTGKIHVHHYFVKSQRRYPVCFGSNVCVMNCAGYRADHCHQRSMGFIGIHGWTDIRQAVTVSL